MNIIVPIIVVVIILLQIYFFIINVCRMKEYKEIFEYESTWNIEHNQETGFVSGISGDGNNIFSSIKESITKYIGSNSGSVIDFHLLKDAVDRHCDAVENDINSLTPVPLYCGLAGTMAGVIVGLASLLLSGAIKILLASQSYNDEASKAVSMGVNDLLEGVAWAMLASICGIVFTTISSVLFKRFKLKGESGKNTFLAWLQSRLLPELPSDTSEALSKLVKNLNKFNNTFSGNTAELKDALKGVNESYRIQADIIQTVHDMDVMKMATANVNVLKELKDCTDKLELFNKYLNDIEGYTDAIHTFTSQFEVEANRLHVLEEIQQFFTRHKGEIIKDSADIDVALRDALNQLKDSTGNNITELNNIFVKQAEEFKNILLEEKESFEKINQDINAQFNAQVSSLPMIEEKLAEVSKIPEKLDQLIERLENSNGMLYKSVSMTMAENRKFFGSKFDAMKPPSFESPKESSGKSNLIILIAAVVIAIATTVNMVHNLLPSDDKVEKAVEQPYNVDNIEEKPVVVDTTSIDSMPTDNPQEMIMHSLK